ncbi:type II toxin-antitoxin system ParD family antitoxin [bacterium]|nr:type II toxin-antitoxin system ParD family antitoxin [bacterium]
MDISLSNDFDLFIKEQMSTGLYKSVNEIIQEALTLFKLRKSISQERIDAFNDEIQKGLDDINNGRYSDGDEFFKELIAKYE